MKFLEKDKLENKLTKKVKSIGILGGTFDPAHLGHVKLSSTARKKFKIDEIIWAVTKKNPFKNKSSKNLKQRIYQAKKLVRDKKYIKVKYYEDKIKSNKTYNLVRYLKKNNKNSDLIFLMGADNLINFHKWFKWREISLNCKILVFDRDGYKANSLKSVSFKRLNKKNLKFVRFKKVNISSSKLRKI